MTDQPDQPAAAGAPAAAPADQPGKAKTFATVPLETPIVRGDQTITEVTLRKPQSGELRGLSLVNVANLDVDALHKLLPRITSPMLTAADVAGMDPADLLSIGAEIGDFLSTREMRASRPT